MESTPYSWTEKKKDNHIAHQIKQTQYKYGKSSDFFFLQCIVNFSIEFQKLFRRVNS